VETHELTSSTIPNRIDRTAAIGCPNTLECSDAGIQGSDATHALENGLHLDGHRADEVVASNPIHYQPGVVRGTEKSWWGWLPFSEGGGFSQESEGVGRRRRNSHGAEALQEEAEGAAILREGEVLAGSLQRLLPSFLAPVTQCA
jgi:hypothetical protein